MAREDYVNSVNLNAGTDFPYLVLHVRGESIHPRNPGFQVMHWHEDLQFIRVFEGEIEVRTLDETVRVHAGEGLYVNRNVVHLVRQLEGCLYKSFLFPARFLEFYPGSPAREQVERITENTGLALLHFTGQEPWHARVLEALRLLAELEEDRTADLYTYRVLARLAGLWLDICENVRLPQNARAGVLEQRMRRMLRYIETHFAEDVTLEDLARSASLGKSECARCFRRSLDTTPYRYLLDYRLSMAARMLLETDESIGGIAAAVGFQQASHFGKCFREKTGCSPKEYRSRQAG
ncbi:MAG: AraC family transcriptional regulator [Desulfovibrionaceae bacterium]|nr:AraC family transcriptional regulator [Desulfovibrionaceae bacterium]